MKKKMFTAKQMIAAVLIGSLIVSPPPLVYGTVEDNMSSLASVLAPFFGVGKEANVPSSTEFSNASLVEKINYLEAENKELQDKLLVLEGGHTSLLSKVDYLQTSSNQISDRVSSVQSLVQGINIPDYSANFTTLAAGMAGINTSLGTVNSNTSGLAQEIASLQTKLDSVMDAVNESTAAASAQYSLYVYVPKSIVPVSCVGYEVSLTSPSGLQTVSSKLKDNGNYWSTKLYFDFAGACNIKYKLPFDNTTDVDFARTASITQTSQELQLSTSGGVNFNSLSWTQIHNALQAGMGQAWFSIGDRRYIYCSAYQGYSSSTATSLSAQPARNYLLAITGVSSTKLIMQLSRLHQIPNALKPAGYPASKYDKGSRPITGNTESGYTDIEGGGWSKTEYAWDSATAGLWNYLDTNIYSSIPSELRQYIPKTSWNVYNGVEIGGYSASSGSGPTYDTSNWYRQTITNRLAPYITDRTTPHLHSVLMDDWDLNDCHVMFCIQ